MTPHEAKALVDAWLKAELDKDADVRLTADLEAIDVHEAQVLRRGPSSGHAYYDPSAADRLVEELIADQGLTLTEAERDLVIRLIRRAHADLFKAVSDRSHKGWFPWSEDDPAASLVAQLQRPASEPKVAGSIPTRASPPTGTMLSDASAAFVEEEARAGLSSGRQKDFKAAYRSFQDWLGRDPDLSEITSRVAGEYRIALSQMPASGATRPQYRELSFAERIARAREAGEHRLLSPTTIGCNYINPLRTLFEWARNTGKINANPFANIRPPRDNKLAMKRERDVFSAKQLAALFAQPLFTGAAATRGKPLYRPGPVIVDDWRFWLPLIGLFSGARLNEMCGLGVADFEQEEGIHFFHIRPDGGEKRVKTQAGVRRVPLHSELMELGLLRRVSRLRDDGVARLFPDIRPGPRGYLSDNPSKFFADLIDKAVGKEEPVVFHSFRHTFITRLRAARVEPLLRMAIVGHDPGETHEQYGEQDIAALSVEVQKVTYPGLDLALIAHRS